MDKWKYLPSDILETVLYYVGESKIIGETFPGMHRITSEKDLLQCQLTCKNWESLAQSMLYRGIYLNSLQKSIAFINTLRDNNNIGSLVRYIDFGYIFNNDIQEDVNHFFHQLALFSPNLKGMHCKGNLDPFFYETIRYERSKNRFLKLEMLPYNFEYGRDYIKQYNMTANILHQSLGQLVIYDNDPELFKDTDRLKAFGNIDTLIFSLSYYNNMYAVDKYILNCPTVRRVFITSSDYKLSAITREVEIGSHINVCPQVRDVQIIDIWSDIRLYTYFMNVFPNTKTFLMDIFCIEAAGLSTDIAINYLHYLIEIPDLDVSYVPLKNINDTMIRFYDSSNTIKKLCIKYFKTDNPHLTICKPTKTNKNTKVCVHYKEDKLLTLPRTGLLEKSGNNLQYLKLEMGLYTDDMDIMANGPDKPDILSYVMSRCSHLQIIKLRNAFLFFKNSSEPKIKPISCKIVDLHNSLIHPSFLCGLSYHFSYITRLTMRNCNFTDQEQYHNSISIDMPNTGFGSIVYENAITVDDFYLMLETTVNNNTVWYYSNKGNYQKCGESDYTESLERKTRLSIFIRCKSINTINISSSLYGVSLKI